MAMDIKTQVQEALKLLSGQCDGASSRDNVGFNGFDASNGRWLASLEDLTPSQVLNAAKMLQKYHNQITVPSLQAAKRYFAINGPSRDNDTSGENDNIGEQVEREPEQHRTEMESDQRTFNACYAIYTNPHSEQTTSHKSAVDDLRNGGTLSRSLPGYQERQPQIEMAGMVEQALEEERHALLEAATGTGKSLGYLIPIVRSGKRAIVSTANKALQEQLFNKDIPFLKQHLQTFNAALVKGMGNYVCLDRLVKEQNEGISAYAPDPELKQVVEATNNSSFTGDFETLPFQVSGELRSKINGDPDECARKKCPLYGQCYYYTMRRQADTAQVIVTNHALLMLDTVSGGKLLPKRDVVVVDEAHMLEGVATDAFTIEIKPNAVYSLLAQKKLMAHTKKDMHKRAIEECDALWQTLQGKFPRDPKINRLALVEPVEQGKKLASTLRILATQMREMKSPTSEKEDALYDRLVERTGKLSDNLYTVFEADNADYVYYMDRIFSKSGVQINVAMVPLTVAGLLRDTLFTDNKVIATSATLATPAKVGGQPSFDFYKQQIGMSNPDQLESILPLVFNYQDNALLYLPDDLPVPAYGATTEAKAYESAIAQKMLALVEASKGRAFLLFSSRRMMQIVQGHIQSQLERDGYNLFIQGDAPTSELVRRFRTTEKAVLFGLRTFWEGVDVAGEALSLVVIDKLPFIPTDDPVMSAKMQYIERLNGPKSSFNVYALPMVVLQLKQGVGRLIRADSDTGVMAILDARMTTTAYGKKILNCLPPAKQVTKISQVEEFFATPHSLPSQIVENKEPEISEPIIEEFPQPQQTSKPVLTLPTKGKGGRGAKSEHADWQRVNFKLSPAVLAKLDQLQEEHPTLNKEGLVDLALRELFEKYGL